MRPVVYLALWLLTPLASCRGCVPNLVQLEPGKLAIEATQIQFLPTYLGSNTTQRLQVANSGQARAAFEARVAGGPFETAGTTFELAGGETTEVVVAFAPVEPGHAESTLRVGDFVIRLKGEGLVVPQCLASDPCRHASFDVAVAACVATTRRNGAACTTPCLATGECVDGACVGRASDCDDHDACTVDACGSTGCVHPAITCQAAGPCQRPSCDATTGCGVVPALDGTLCGVDDCTATRVDVCINGSCVNRPRPNTGRCANTWVTPMIPGRYGHALAYDAARQRVVLFGGGDFADTWEWDGAAWLQRTPAASPSARGNHALAYDAARQRVVLFGGYDHTALSDTWEWDGTTWLQRTPATAPPPRFAHALAYDAARQRVVLFGGFDGSRRDFDDTWEWDGTTWLQRTPATSPPPRSAHALVYDSVRQRVVLFGGHGQAGTTLSDTWEWDGATWVQRTPATSPPPRYGHALAYDSARQRVVLFSGFDGFDDTWEWDGATWLQRTPATSPSPRYTHALAYDAARKRVVLFGGGDASSSALVDTWEWDGATWLQRARVTSPPPRSSHALAYDAAHQRVVLFGGSGTPHGFYALHDTWEWNGATWLERTPATSPPPRGLHALAYDVARQRVVLFGGRIDYGMGSLSDTWEWDGTTWLQRTPTISPPPRYDHALAYDSARERVVLFGGGDDSSNVLSDTWEWNGATWQRFTPATSPPPRTGHTLAYDVARQRVVLFGGVGNLGFFSDTWEWDGATWLERAPATSPAPRGGHAFAYDAARQRVVLFGGSGNLGFFSDTWEWDGATWLERAPTTSPPPRADHALAYDAAQQRVVLFGGAGSLGFTETWLLLP